ncbi:hypothetical protein BJF93_03500 [Xaviernesmea oryzae]|uniref:Outer membrane protein beta-barrel domain-containing protein n=1 Tax=Xaviernesmea oryzae TaxID=464029 RepID=A0A1Q9AZK3_9HYPH|nr:outer membrane protein [Xaviernesmea oryzae]OLP61125.1 hypothetical protein BJF93_03500 [Xaviernesmea oryzae]SEL12359.1 Opacity protein [Xaviernesmea oryzae]
MERGGWWIAAGLLVVLAAGAPAHGADMNFEQVPEVVIGKASDSPTLYLRGDIGFTVKSKGGDASLKAFDGTSTRTIGFDEVRFGEPLAGTIGIGARVNDMLRTDITAEYFQGDFKGDSDVLGACSGEASGTNCHHSHKADYEGISLMANGYVDLATIAGITPYIGAGVGATRLSYGSVKESWTCQEAGAACSGNALQGERYDGEASWRFTYALMAGASYNLTDRLALDVGYRYSDIADGKIFDYKGWEAANGATGDKTRDDGLRRHEIRAGLRFFFD